MSYITTFDTTFYVLSTLSVLASLAGIALIYTASKTTGDHWIKGFFSVGCNVTLNTVWFLSMVIGAFFSWKGTVTYSFYSTIFFTAIGGAVVAYMSIFKKNEWRNLSDNLLGRLMELSLAAAKK